MDLLKIDFSVPFLSDRIKFLSINDIFVLRS